MKKILNGPRVYRAHCHVCDTEFEYTYDEVIEIDTYGKPEECDKFIRCPNCESCIEHWGNPSSKTQADMDNMDTMSL